MSVSIHLTTPTSNNLYQRAIIQSNPITEADNVTYATSRGIEFASKLGCPTVDATCLKSVPVGKVTQLSITYLWQPTIDYDYIPDWPLNAMANGAGNQVPLIIGTTQHESAEWVAEDFPYPLSATEYNQYLTQEYSDFAPEVEALYPAFDGDNRINVALLTTHRYWTCPNYQFANASKLKNGNPVWMYSYEHIGSFYATENLCNITVCHGAELPLLFDTVSYASKGAINLTPEEDILSMKMGNYWANFTLTGEASWPQYIEEVTIGNVTTEVQIFVPTITTRSNYLDEFCQFWDSFSQSGTQEFPVQQLSI